MEPAIGDGVKSRFLTLSATHCPSQASAFATQKKTCIPESRACLKNAFCKMCVTICGRFRPDEGAVAGYSNQIRLRYTAKRGVQIAGMIFQTGSRSGIILHALLYTALYLSTLQSALHPVFRIHRKPSQIFLAMGFPLCMGVLCG